MEPKFVLQFYVDKQDHVVFAESTGDFVDILFSFLTLPLATIIRLISKKQPTEIGCINNLYTSVENFDTEDFWNYICKQMLLRPSSPCDALCRKLKLNLDYKEPTKYFLCSNCYSSIDGLLSTFPNSTCTCGRLMDKEMKFEVEDNSSEAKVNGVFVEGKAMYLIFDNLKVMKGTPGNVVEQLIQLGFKDLSNLTVVSRAVGLNEILDLLKQALTSKSPFTDVFLGLALPNVEPKPQESFCPKLGAARNCKMELEVTVNKSSNKILYAEAEEDFMDFLLSFLTIPLGSILKLLNGNSSLGCIDNLYRSVEVLDPSLCHASCTALLDAAVASQFGCSNQPLNIVEQAPPTYWFGMTKSNTGVTSGCFKTNSKIEVISTRQEQLINARELNKFFEPRSPDGTKAIGFVKRPATFAVLDDLTVSPLSSNSSFHFLHKLDTPLEDLEKYVVSIGEAEALNLLKASLTSKAALAGGLSLSLENAKRRKFKREEQS